MSAKIAQESGMPSLALLAKLKSGSSTAAAASGAASAKPAAASGQSQKAPATDTVSLSAQAVAGMNASSGGLTTQPLQLQLAGGLELGNWEEQRRRMDVVMKYHEEALGTRFAAMKSLRGQFGLESEIEGGGGIMLSGDIGKVIDRQMETRGLGMPEKSQEVKDWEAERASKATPPPPGWDKTSMITLFLPGTKGTGDKQIEILLDNTAFDKLNKMSADDVKAGLVDMLNGPDAAASKAAVDNGAFGAVMRGDSEHHPEWQNSKARLGFFDPAQGIKSQPWLMIQSESEPGYVKENAGKLVDAVMNILKEGAAGRSGA